MNDKTKNHVHAPLPRSILMLGMVSLFMDMSSELIHSLLPALLVTVLGANMVTIGIIEGVAALTELRWVKRSIN